MCVRRCCADDMVCFACIQRSFVITLCLVWWWWVLLLHFCRKNRISRLANQPYEMLLMLLFRCMLIKRREVVAYHCYTHTHGTIHSVVVSTWNHILNVEFGIFRWNSHFILARTIRIPLKITKIMQLRLLRAFFF